MRKSMLILPTLLLAGCQTFGPTWSEVSGARYHRIEMHRTQTIIQAVDGKTAIPLQGRDQVVRAAPGKRVVTLRAAPLQPAAIREPDSERFVVDLAPCRRYYVNAQYESATATSWTPVIDFVEPIAGCT